MYALVASKKNEDMVLIDISYTLSDAQAKWDKHFGVDDGNEFVGILTVGGLVNFLGVPMRPTDLGYVVAALGLRQEEADAEVV